MTTRKKLALIISPILLLCILCAAPWAYIAYRDNQAYEANVDRLYEIAEQLGYTEENHLNFYRTNVSGIDYSDHSVTLIFYSVEPIEQFSEKVDSLQFVETTYSKNYQPVTRSFLRVLVNSNSAEKLLTLSNTYSPEDFHPVNRPPPVVTKWGLQMNDGQKKQLNIYNAQKPKADDVWLLGDETIPGNIVVIKLFD